ncbi:hypothetical protein MMC07_008153 [Pseudocyphellaria aurata]|nr:hypothetical protein [Pseudocyphellaria aurata]
MKGFEVSSFCLAVLALSHTASGLVPRPLGHKTGARHFPTPSGLAARGARHGVHEPIPLSATGASTSTLAAVPVPTGLAVSLEARDAPAGYNLSRTRIQRSTIHSRVEPLTTLHATRHFTSVLNESPLPSSVDLDARSIDPHLDSLSTVDPLSTVRKFHTPAQSTPRSSNPAPRSSDPTPRSSNPFPRSSNPAPRSSNPAPRSSHPTLRSSNPTPTPTREPTFSVHPI